MKYDNKKCLQIQTAPGFERKFIYTFKHWFPHNSSVCSDEGLTLETSAKHHIPQATNIPYQPLLIKPIFSVLTHAEKQFFFQN